MLFVEKWRGSPLLVFESDSCINILLKISLKKQLRTAERTLNKFIPVWSV